jgi:hypothetical protein
MQLPLRSYNISWMAGVAAVTAVIVIGVFACAYRAEWVIL